MLDYRSVPEFFGDLRIHFLTIRFVRFHVVDMSFFHPNFGHPDFSKKTMTTQVIHTRLFFRWLHQLVPFWTRVLLHKQTLRVSSIHLGVLQIPYDFCWVLLVNYLTNMQFLRGCWTKSCKLTTKHASNLKFQAHSYDIQSWCSWCMPMLRLDNNLSSNMLANIWNCPL